MGETATSSIERCVEYDRDGGRCQLVTGHDDVHAAYLGGGTCLTWASDDRPDDGADDNGVSRQVRHWQMSPPPPWLVMLPWAPDCQLPWRSTAS